MQRIFIPPQLITTMLSALALSLLPAVSADTFRAFAVGDWGGASKFPFTTPVQLTTAEAMGKVGAVFKPQQIWGIGDNFYEDGIACSGDNSRGCTADANSHRFTDTFENVYTAPSLNVPWWFNGGNHDWHAVANTTAELVYATRKDRKSSRWNYPAFYYTKTDTVLGANGVNFTVQLVMVDTVILCGLTVPHGRGQPIPPPLDTPIPPAAPHWAWLASTLAASQADVLIVSGHYPVYSVAEHGSTACLVEQLQPLLVAHKAALYVSGHDHQLQWIDDGSGVGYFHTGAGHEVDTDQSHASTVPAGAAKFFAAPPTGGFVSLEIANKSSLDLTYYSGEGAVVYEVKAWPNPRAA